VLRDIEALTGTGIRRVLADAGYKGHNAPLAHAFKIVGERTGKSTWVITPGTNFQAFFREVAAFPPGPPDFSMLEALHEKHGMIMPQPE
jgi:hypothetical protein